MKIRSLPVLSTVSALLMTAGVASVVALPGRAIGADSATASAGKAEDAVRVSVESWLRGRFKVDEVRATPMKDMYEVRIGEDLMYVDASGRFAFVEGQMVDLKANANLTKARMEDLQKIRFSDLPLQYAIKQVNGSGKRVLAVFEDPNCTYCKKLRGDLVALKDATIYTFPYPILAADSATKSKKAWCASDRAAAWNEMMISGKVPSNDGGCENPVDRVSELGRKLKINGTPTIFFTNGKRVPGAIAPEKLEAMLKESEEG